MVANFQPSDRAAAFSESAIDEKHLSEWVQGSGVAEAIVQRNVRSLSDQKVIAEYLGWKAYKHTPGWWVTGVDPKTGEKMSPHFGQFKPDEPIQFPDREKAAKYLTPHVGYDALCLDMEVNENGTHVWGDKFHVIDSYWPAIIANPEVPIVITEGGKKAGSALSHGYPTIALFGVEMGLQAIAKGSGKKLVPNLEPFIVPGRTVYLAFDMDILQKPEVRSALKRLAAPLLKMGVTILIPNWDTKYKGIDDLIVNAGEQEFRKALEEAQTIEKWEKQFRENSKSKKSDEQPKAASQSDVAAALAEKYKPQLAWDVKLKEWKRYSSEIKGIWSKEPEEFVAQLVMSEIAATGQSYKADFIRGILYLLKSLLAVREWHENPMVLPLENGTLDLLTRELKPHSPSNYLTWCLPYKYNSLATCEPIQEWMLSIVEGDRDQLQVLRAYLNAVLLGRTELQRYLELIGLGGTGKSTYFRLAMALVGVRNTHITTLVKLEGSRFETACIHGKRLVIVTDSERYAGNVTTLKALTGQDPLPYEKKFMQSTEGFAPKAMVIVAANEIIQSADYTSGLERRRLTMWLQNQIPLENQRNLISVESNKVSGEFLPFIPGLLNWVLEMSDEEVRYYVKNTKAACPSLSQKKAESFLDTNPIADWADQFLVIREGFRSQTGSAKKSKDREDPHIYQHTEKWLYANYCEYSDSSGTRPLALRRFINLLHDLLVGQLKFSGISKGRDRNGSFFKGIALRSDGDKDFCIISGKPPSPPPPPPPPKPRDGKSQNCDGSVTTETLTSDGCDGCDGISEKCHREEKKNLQESSTSPKEGESEPSICHHVDRSRPQQTLVSPTIEALQKCDGNQVEPSHIRHTSNAVPSQFDRPETDDAIANTGDRTPEDDFLPSEQITDDYLKAAAESAAFLISLATTEEDSAQAEYQAQAAKGTLEKEILAYGDRGPEYKKLVWSLLSAPQQQRFRQLLGTPQLSKDSDSSLVESTAQKEEDNGLKVGDRAVSTVTGEEVSIERIFERKGVMFAAVRYVSCAYINDSQCGESRLDWLKPLNVENEES